MTGAGRGGDSSSDLDTKRCVVCWRWWPMRGDRHGNERDLRKECGDETRCMDKVELQIRRPMMDDALM